MSRRVSPRTIALRIARIALEKRAQEIVILDIADKVDYADYLVICSGNSKRHVRTIAAELEGTLKRKRIVPMGIEGEIEGNWILIDYGSVVVHVFQRETRQHYDIEGLWLDADRIVVEDSTGT